jgi:hypothetical protein
MTIEPSLKLQRHLVEMLIYYGDAYVDWYEKEGLELFFKWAENQGLKFTRLDKK